MPVALKLAVTHRSVEWPRSIGVPNQSRATPQSPLMYSWVQPTVLKPHERRSFTTPSAIHFSRDPYRAFQISMLWGYLRFVSSRWLTPMVMNAPPSGSTSHHRSSACSSRKKPDPANRFAALPPNLSTWPMSIPFAVSVRVAIGS